MSNGVTFTPDAAKRIAKVVKRVEHMPEQMGGRNPSSSTQHDDNFWVRIKDAYVRIDHPDGTITYELYESSTYNGPLWYSWEKVIPGKRGGFLTADPPVEGIANARYINEQGPDDLIGYGTCTRLHLVGFDEQGDPLYVFIDGGDRTIGYAPVPVHDHRSNDPGYGGFAFACYAPGTSLPQMPWVI